MIDDIFAVLLYIVVLVGSAILGIIEMKIFYNTFMMIVGFILITTSLIVFILTIVFGEEIK